MYLETSQVSDHSPVVAYAQDRAAPNADVRVKAMLSETVIVGCGSFVEGVVGPVHQGVLAEHGSHRCLGLWSGSNGGKVGGRVFQEMGIDDVVAMGEWRNKLG